MSRKGKEMIKLGIAKSGSWEHHQRFIKSRKKYGEKKLSFHIVKLEFQGATKTQLPLLATSKLQTNWAKAIHPTKHLLIIGTFHLPGEQVRHDEFPSDLNYCNLKTGALAQYAGCRWDIYASAFIAEAPVAHQSLSGRPLWWTQGFFLLARFCTHFPNSRWALPRCHLALQAPKATFDTHFKLQTVKCVSKKPRYLLSQSWRHGYRPSTAAGNCNFSGVGGGAGALQAKGDTNDVAGLLAGGLSWADSLYWGFAPTIGLMTIPYYMEIMGV